MSPSPVYPCTKDFPSPAPLVFTPLKALVAVNSPLPEKPTVGSCLNCDAEMTPDHQCETLDSESNWEGVEIEQDLVTKTVNCDEVASIATTGQGLVLKTDLPKTPGRILNLKKFCETCEGLVPIRHKCIS